MTRSFNYSHWLYGLAGGALIVAGLLALIFQDLQYWGAKLFAPWRNWWHGNGSPVGCEAWAFSLLLFSFMAVHIGFALRQSNLRYQRNKSLVVKLIGSPKPHHYLRFFQNVSGMIVLFMACVLGYSLMSVEPDWSYVDWYGQYPTLESYIMQLAIAPLVALHVVIGACRLVWRWWPTHAASLFYRQPVMAILSYLAIVLLGSGLYSLYYLAFVTN